jgi:pSer/pThr/pTyr-binding forkhead associated (FHA) protein
MTQHFQSGAARRDAAGNEQRKESGVFPRDEITEGGWGFVLPHSDGRFQIVAARDGATIGTSGKVDVRIDGPDVAAEHARLEVRADGVYLEDLDSEGGTYVGGVRARRIGVVHGDLVRFGGVMGVFVERGLARYEGRTDPDRPFFAGPREEARFVEPALAHGRSGRSFVIEGGPGLGKRTLAQMAAKEREQVGPVVTILASELRPDTIAQARARRPMTWVLVFGEQLPRASQAEVTQAITRTIGSIAIATMEIPLDRALSDGVVAPAFAAIFGGRRIPVPPLSARREDISGIVGALARKLGIDRSRLSIDLLEQIARAGWPGGIVEIEEVLREAAARTDGALHAGDIQRELTRPPSYPPSPPAADDPGLARARLTDALAKANGSIASAARTLGMSRQAVYREAQRLGLEVGKRRAR